MRLLSGEALLLDIVDLHDFDRIVTFLTCEQGQKRGVAKGSRRKFSRFAGQLQLLAKVSIQWRETDHRDLVRIDTAELIQPAGPLLEDLEGILAASYMAEHLVKFTQENEESELYFRLVSSTLEALRNGVERSLALRYFEAWILRLAGIFPIPRECLSCGRDLRRTGATLPQNGEGIVCQECLPAGAQALRVGAPCLDFLRRSGRTSLAEMQQAPPSGAALDQVEEICGRVRRGFLNQELRSYEVMKATLGGRSDVVP